MNKELMDEVFDSSVLEDTLMPNNKTEKMIETEETNDIEDNESLEMEEFPLNEEKKNDEQTVEKQTADAIAVLNQLFEKGKDTDKIIARQASIIEKQNAEITELEDQVQLKCDEINNLNCFRAGIEFELEKTKKELQRYKEAYNKIIDSVRKGNSNFLNIEENDQKSL